jgi:hypothetical protein
VKGDWLYLQTALVRRAYDGSVGIEAFPGRDLREIISALKDAAELKGAKDQTERRGTRAMEANGGNEAGRGAEASGVDGCGLISEMVRASGMGSYIRTALFASGRGSITQLHYDHYDNLYLQLHGTKRVILFDPQQVAELGLGVEVGLRLVALFDPQQVAELGLGVEVGLRLVALFDPQQVVDTITSVRHHPALPCCSSLPEGMICVSPLYPLCTPLYPLYIPS